MSVTSSAVGSSRVLAAKMKKAQQSIAAPERLKMTLKEKEAKIEQLMKDREMERAQIAKAANQTDEAENKLGLLKEEYWGNKVLLLPDVSFQDATGFLELVYTGKVEIT